MTKPTPYSNTYSNKKFIKLYKKADVRIRKQVDDKLRIFGKNPHDLGLRNHELHGEWEGYRSIDITNDYRAIYKKAQEGEEAKPYFVAIGTHEELYENPTKTQE